MSLITKKRRVKRRRRRRPDERQEGHSSGINAAGLGGLQQRVGNRAVQRMITSEQIAERQAAKKKAAKQQALIKQQQMMAQEQAVEEAVVEEKIEQVVVYEKYREIAGLQEPEEVVDKPDMDLLSGEKWVTRYPANDKLVDLDAGFGNAASNFIKLLEKAGARVDVLSTTWPAERAYMMHFAWLIANKMIDPRQVPAIDEVDFGTDESLNLDIVWWHGNYDDSQSAAEEMAKAFGIQELEEPPPLASRHVSGEAIDMRISWSSEVLLLELPNGDEVEISSGSKDETNVELMEFAAALGVVHYDDTDEDAVHWSVDGS